jgi:hypothetical protein
MSKRIKFLYNPQEGDQAISDSEDNIVFFVDQIAPEVITGIVDMWNQDISLETLLKTVYKNTDQVSPDEYEYIKEQIEAYIALDKQEEETIMEDTAQVKETAGVTGNEVVNKSIEAIKNVPQEVIEKAAASVGVKKGPKPKSNGQKIDAKSLIEQMQEKIALISYIDTIQVEDLPAGTKVSKESREIILTLQRGVENLKQSALSQLNDL